MVSGAKSSIRRGSAPRASTDFTETPQAPVLEPVGGALSREGRMGWGRGSTEQESKRRAGGQRLGVMQRLPVPPAPHL